MPRFSPESFNVLFVHVPKRSSYYKPFDEFMFINYIPMGVFGLCDILNKNGIRSSIKHLGLEYILDKTFSIIDYVRDQNVTMVAMSLHWHFQAYDVIEVAKKLKQADKKIIIVLGGFTAGNFADEIMTKYDCIDFIITGDGEKGILQLAETVRDGNDAYAAVANCVYRKSDTIINNGITYLADFTELTDVDYANLSLLDHHREYRDYFKVPLFWSLNASAAENKRRRVSGAATTFPLMIGKGCNFDCSFCGGGRIAQTKICNRKKADFMPVSKVIATMEAALGYGYESFIVSFDPTPSDSRFYRDLFAEIRRRNIICGMGFESWGLPDEQFIEAFGATFTKETSYIALSPETGVEKLRKRNKGLYYSNEELYGAMQTIDNNRIPMTIYLTIGLPGETSADIRQNRMFSKHLMKKFRYVKNVLTIPIQLEPGSPMFEHPDRHGVTPARKCFSDFYDFHGQPGSNPYTDFGYVSHSLDEAHGDQKLFNQYLLKERCNKFCMIPIRLFGKFYIPAFSRLLCSLMHRRWIQRGFGKVPATRKTF